MSNDITDLRAHLFETLKGLKDKSIDIDTAKAVSQIADNIIDTAKVEVDFLRANGSVDTQFFHKPELAISKRVDDMDDDQKQESHETKTGSIAVDICNGQRIVTHRMK